MGRDLEDYDPGMGTVNRDLVIQHHDARDHVIDLLDALVAPPKERPPVPLRELSALTALQWSWERFAREGQHAQASLHDRLLLAEQAAAASAAEAYAESQRAERLEPAASAGRRFARGSRDDPMRAAPGGWCRATGAGGNACAVSGDARRRRAAERWPRYP